MFIVYLKNSNLIKFLLIVATDGVLSVKWCGTAGEDQQAMVMNLLGPSLHDLWKSCNYRFSLKTVLQLALQSISRLNVIHEHSIVHLDLKPGNMMMGLNNKSTLYIADFGVAQEYRDPVTLEHKAFGSGRYLVGTPSYCSINMHKGHEPSRRDDLEALGYILVYLRKGSLPWSHVDYLDLPDQKKYEQMYLLKKTVPLEEICKGLPEEFVTYLKYTRGLGFDEEPDYAYMYYLFEDLFDDCRFVDDNLFDWDKSPTNLWPESAYRVEHSKTCNLRTRPIVLESYQEALEQLDAREIEILKEEVKQLIAGFSGGLSPTQLQAEYRKLKKSCIPLFQYGYCDLLEFVPEIQGIKISKDGSNKTVFIEEVQDLKNTIKSLIADFADGVSPTTLQTEYRRLTGGCVPLFQNGYCDLHDLVREIEEVTISKNQSGKTIFLAHW